jgi:predicted MPP superfamily phosphohydrolase
MTIAIAAALAALDAIGIAGALVWFYNRTLADLHESVFKKAVALGCLPAACVAGAALGVASVRPDATGHPLHFLQALLLPLAIATLRQAHAQWRIDRRDAHAARLTPKPMRRPAEAIDRAALSATERALLRLAAPVNGATDLQLREYEIAFPELPAELDGYRIVHITDIHIHRFLSRAYLDHAIATANAAGGDTILFGGDAITRAKHIPRIAETMAPLRARDGVYAVRGNHDYWTRPGAVAAQLAAAGIRTLANEAAIITRGGGRLAIIGIEAPYLPLTPRMAAALGEECRGAFRIALVHTPLAFPRAAECGAALALAGHTHGGQVRLPFFGSTLSSQPLGPGYTRGLHRWRSMKTIVSAGVGAFFPVRVNCPPEVVAVTLRRGA